MSRKPLEFVSGLAVYFVLSLIITWGIILRLPILPVQFITWLGQSSNPQSALYYFSLALSATILFLLRIGVEIPPMKAFISSDKLKPYLSGLPIWALGLFWAGSLFGFWGVFPSCQPPVTVNFSVSERDALLKPSDTVKVSAGEVITVTAKPIEDDVTLSCSWEYAGTIFQTIGSQRGCKVSARFNDQHGSGFMTVSVSENFCSQSSIFSLQVLTEP